MNQQKNQEVQIKPVLVQGAILKSTGEKVVVMESFSLGKTMYYGIMKFRDTPTRKGDRGEYMVVRRKKISLPKGEK